MVVMKHTTQVSVIRSSDKKSHCYTICYKTIQRETGWRTEEGTLLLHHCINQNTRLWNEQKAAGGVVVTHAKLCTAAWWTAVLLAKLCIPPSLNVLVRNVVCFTEQRNICPANQSSKEQHRSPSLEAKSRLLWDKYRCVMWGKALTFKMDASPEHFLWKCGRNCGKYHGTIAHLWLHVLVNDWH